MALLGTCSFTDDKSVFLRASYSSKASGIRFALENEPQKQSIQRIDFLASSTDIWNVVVMRLRFSMSIGVTVAKT